MRKTFFYLSCVCVVLSMSFGGCGSRSSQKQNAESRVTASPSLSVQEQVTPIVPPSGTPLTPPAQTGQTPPSTVPQGTAVEPSGEPGLKLAELYGKRVLDYFLSGKFKEAAAELMLRIRQNPKDAAPYYHLGTLYLDAGLVKESIPVLEKAARLKPDDVKIAGALATAYKQIGRVNDALIIIASTAKKQAENQKAAQIILYAPSLSDISKVYYDRGLYAVEKGKFTKAVFEFKKAREYMELPQCLYYIGRIYVLQRRFRDAEESFKEAIRQDPTNPDYYVELGKIYFRSRMYNEALANFSKALQQDPNAREAYFGRGNTLYRLGNADEAKVDFKSGLSIDPSLAPYHFNWGWAYLRAGSHDKAIDEFIKTVTSNMNHTQAHLYLAVSIVDKVLHQKANPKDQKAAFISDDIPPEQLLKISASELKRALQLYPFLSKGHFYLGLYYLMQKGSDEDFQHAFLEMRQAVDLEPRNAMYHHLLGIAYSRRGLMEEAIREIRKCIRLSPKNADAYFSLGVIFVNLDKLELARSAFLKVVAMDPGNQDGYLSLASTYFALGQRENALRAVRRAVGLDPDYLNNLFEKGTEFYQKGMLNQAIEVYKTMTLYDPKSARPHYLLGLLYYVKGFDTLSLNEFNTALRLDPSQRVASVAAYIIKDLRRKKHS